MSGRCEIFISREEDFLFVCQQVISHTLEGISMKCSEEMDLGKKDYRINTIFLSRGYVCRSKNVFHLQIKS